MKMLSMEKEELSNYLKAYNQEHLVSFWDELSDEEKHQLFNEINQIEFAELNASFLKAKAENEAFKKLDDAMESLPADIKGSYQTSTPEQVDSYRATGLKAISASEVAVVLLAGGQGTRLGVTYPKGMYSVDLPSNKTLFQLQAERLRRVQEMADKNAVIPWYIMTSENTQRTIKDYFEQNDYFHLNKEHIMFFEQGNLPCLTRTGQLLLDQKNKISRAPDGNGGLYKALLKSNVLADMASRGVKYIHIYCVDNILIRIADPVFIGFCLEQNFDCAAKVVKKIEPDENVGVICKVNNKFQVVEYSEISEETRNEREENGDLSYNAGNICNHFLTFDFLDNVCRHHEKHLKHHVAEKKISYIDESGLLKKPSTKNGIKLEKFIFDIFEFSERFGVWEVVRRDEFSPLKNGTDELNDNAVTCRKHILEQHARWLGVDHSNVEVSPLVSYAGEGLESWSSHECDNIEEPMVLEKNFKSTDLEQPFILLKGKNAIQQFYTN